MLKESKTSSFIRYRSAICRQNCLLVEALKQFCINATQTVAQRQVKGSSGEFVGQWVVCSCMVTPRIEYSIFYFDNFSYPQTCTSGQILSVAVAITRACLTNRVSKNANMCQQCRHLPQVRFRWVPVTRLNYLYIKRTLTDCVLDVHAKERLTCVPDIFFEIQETVTLRYVSPKDI